MLIAKWNASGFQREVNLPGKAGRGFEGSSGVSDFPRIKLMHDSTPKVSLAPRERSSLNFPTCRECSDTGFIPAKGGVVRCGCRQQQARPPESSTTRACTIPLGKAKNQRERMIAKLEEAGERGVTNVEFVAMRIFRYSSRLRENRQKLFDIETIHVRGGLYRYILHSKPSVPTPVPSFQPRPRADSTPSLFASVPGGR